MKKQTPSGMVAAEVIYNRVAQIDAICSVVAVVDTKTDALPDSAISEVMYLVAELASEAKDAIVQLQDEHSALLRSFHASSQGASHESAH